MVDVKRTDKKDFPIKIFIQGKWQYFTEKAAREIKNKFEAILIDLSMGVPSEKDNQVKPEVGVTGAAK